SAVGWARRNGGSPSCVARGRPGRKSSRHWAARPRGGASSSPAPWAAPHAPWAWTMRTSMPEPEWVTPTAPDGTTSALDRVAAIRRGHRARWLRGDRVPVEDYLGGVEPAVDAESALVLIHGEYLLRQELGEAPTLEEYLDRFPALAERLRLVDSVHRLL